MNGPYHRWRQVVYGAGIAATAMLTLSILLTLLGCLLAWFGVGVTGTDGTGTPTGY